MCACALLCFHPVVSCRRFLLLRSGHRDLHAYSRSVRERVKMTTLSTWRAPPFDRLKHQQGDAANAAARCEFFLSRIGLCQVLRATPRRRNGSGEKATLRVANANALSADAQSHVTFGMLPIAQQWVCAKSARMCAKLNQHSCANQPERARDIPPTCIDLSFHIFQGVKRDRQSTLRLVSQRAVIRVAGDGANQIRATAYAGWKTRSSRHVDELQHHHTGTQ